MPENTTVLPADTLLSGLVAAIFEGVPASAVEENPYNYVGLLLRHGLITVEDKYACTNWQTPPGAYTAHPCLSRDVEICSGCSELYRDLRILREHEGVDADG